MRRSNWTSGAIGLIGAALLASVSGAAEVNTSTLGSNGWFSDDTRADGTAGVPEAPGTDLISPTLTDDPEGSASGVIAHDDDIMNQIGFGTATGTVPSGTHPGSVRLTIAPTVGAGKSQISHRKDDGVGFATGDALEDSGFFVEYSWRGDGTSTVTASFKIGFQTAEFGATGGSGRTGENAWDKVLIYEPGNLNGGTSDGTWQTESVDYDNGRWWFFDRTAIAGSIGTPLTLADMSTSAVEFTPGKTIQDVYDLITDPSAIITSIQFGIGSGNAGGDVQVNQLETSFYRPGDTTTFGMATEMALVAQDDCISAGEQVVVEVQLLNPNGEMVTGAQAFMNYDISRLSFVGAAAGSSSPFDQMPFFVDDDPGTGELTIANGDPSGVFFTTGDAVVAELTFDVIGEFCGEADLVELIGSPTPPSSYFSGIGGMPIVAALSNLGPLTSDVTPPTVLSVDVTSGGVILDSDDAALSQLTVPDTITTDAFIGDGCWRDSTTGGTFYYLPLQYVGRAFTVGEIANITYHTKDSAADNFDWFFAIYTTPDGIDDDAWYGRRLTCENLYAENRNETVGAWNDWSTDDDGDSVLTFFDSNQGTGFGFFGGPTLAEVQGPGFNWNDYIGTANDVVIDYASEEVWLISIATGSGWPIAWDGLIDAFTIELTTGETVTYDFEQSGSTPTFDASCVAVLDYTAVLLDGCSLDPSSVMVNASSATSAVMVDSVDIVDGPAGSLFVSGTVTVTGSTACVSTVDVTVDVMDDCGNPAPTGMGSADVADVTPPVISGCPTDITVLSDAGGCGAIVSWTEPTATDSCAGPISPVSSHLPGDFFGLGTTTVTYTFDDGCGNVSVCTFDVTVEAENEVMLDVDLDGAFAVTFDRCLVLEFTGVDATTVERTVTFVNGVLAGYVTNIPCGDYDCVTITDPLHSLSRSVSLTVSGTSYVATALAVDGESLLLGNLNGDGFIDILDFGVYVSQFGATYGGVIDTDCMTVGPHADLNGSGLVEVGDFTFIQANFLEFGDLGCGAPDFGGDIAGVGGPLGSIRGPVTRISNDELRRLGLAHLVRGDVNGDGWLDRDDVVDFFAP